MHGTCAALPVIATLFCAGDGYRFTNAIQQGGAGIDAKLMVLTINAENQWDRALDGGRVRVSRGRTLLSTRGYGNARTENRCCRYSPSIDEKFSARGACRTR